ncbi:MAG: roadblock/LC7 domain-containing protein [Fibrobacter sp.]|nr:roadblock/LC7 domain-containing protein [Fibrobacter sp.]
MSDFTIYSDDAEKVRRLMSAYQASVKAEYIVLCHRDGSIIAEVGSLGLDATPLAVLSTASFDSASQVGLMLGGETFNSVSYTGENRSIYITPVDQALLLVQIFPDSKLPNRIDDFNRLLVEKLRDAVPAFTQNTSRLVR